MDRGPGTPRGQALRPWVAALLLAAAGAAPGEDRIELETQSIRGAKELPKVIYIVPWKNSRLGGLMGAGGGGSFAESLQPLDPEVFGLQVRYYGELEAGGAAAR